MNCRDKSEISLNNEVSLVAVPGAILSLFAIIRLERVIRCNQCDILESCLRQRCISSPKSAQLRP